MPPKQRRQGEWFTFAENRHAQKGEPQRVKLTTGCISTSAEVSGHYHSVVSSGRIVGINDTVTASPHVLQDGAALVQE